MSEEAKVIYTGATASQLATIFGMTPQEVNKRIGGRVTPSVPGKAPRYLIRDAAPFLCNPVFDIEEFLKNMTPSKLPPMLQDAFWKAQNNRQEFEENQGDLWRTSRVVEVLMSVFKVIRMTALMFQDTVERQAELTPKQRQIIIELSDGLIETARKNLVDEFKDYHPPEDEHGRPLDSDIDIYEDAEANARAHAAEEFDDGFDD